MEALRVETAHSSRCPPFCFTGGLATGSIEEEWCELIGNHLRPASIAEEAARQGEKLVDAACLFSDCLRSFRHQVFFDPRSGVAALHGDHRKAALLLPFKKDQKLWVTFCDASLFWFKMEDAFAVLNIGWFLTAKIVKPGCRFAPQLEWTGKTPSL